MQKSARARRIDDKASPVRDVDTVSRASQMHLIPCVEICIQRNCVDVLYPKSLRLTHQKFVKISAVPVRVSNLVVGTRGNKKLVRNRVPARVIKIVVEEGKTALQTTRQLRIVSLPAAPLCQRLQSGKIVPLSDIFE